VIFVEDFHKAYGGKMAVAGLSFRVASGQVLGLIGPNGAGKTTTLTALCGLLPPSHGRLSVAGFDVLADPLEVKQRLAYVPDDPQLFSDLTVDEHLAFTAAAYRVPEADLAALELLDRFQLAGQRHTPAADLSRGMRQKLAICCAYLRRPSVLLFDEPLTGLDPWGIRTLKESIRRQARSGAAVIVSSHLLAMVEDLCTHVLMLERGAQRYCGTLAELKERFSAGDGEEATLEKIFFMTTELSNECAGPARDAGMSDVPAS
jgi:ABC-2 type transport system ATP-binding protein